MIARLRREWRFRDGAILVALTTLAFVASKETWAMIFATAWRDEENSYILLAPVIAIWLFWIRRERLRFCTPQATITGPAVIIVGWIMATIGVNHGYEIGEHLGALLIALGAAVTVVGWRFVRAFLPAFIALIFLLPTPGTIRGPVAIQLQETSATITTSILETFGIPIMQQGNILVVNGYDVAVAEACNGMRMISALALITYAFVFSVPMRQSVRAGFLICSPLIALVVNIIRLAPTVLLYGYSDKGTADAFHNLSGWAMLGIALLILWAFQSLLRWLEIPIRPYSAGIPERA